MESADVSLGMLYEAALREARDEAVQEMDPDFYRAASEYLGRLRHERYDNVEAAVKRAVTSRATLMLSLLLEMRLEKAAGRRGRPAGRGAAPASSSPPAGGPPGARDPPEPAGPPADEPDAAPPLPGAPEPPPAGGGNLLDEEKYILYPGTDMDERRALVLDGIVSGRPRLLESVTGAHRTRLVTIRMLAPVAEMTGADLSRYGPYSAEDVATIPLENAAGLISQGQAARVGADRG